jgi:hypothetical protein
LSFAVLEHVNEPWLAVWHSTRTLKLGGFAFHTILTQDHRSFSKVAGYSPFSFRSHNKKEWPDITNNKFYQNRLLPIEWKNLMEKSGVHIDRFIIFKEVEPDEHLFSTFHSDFNEFSNIELSEIDCIIIGRKISIPFCGLLCSWYGHCIRSAFYAFTVDEGHRLLKKLCRSMKQ